MHTLLLTKIVELCRRRQKQGDYPTEASASVEALENAVVQLSEPIPMILHCSRCHMQHVDEAEPEIASEPNANGVRAVQQFRWDNPPHRTHLCHGCGFRWRPADVPTTGVLKISTVGQNDDIDYTIDVPHVAKDPNVAWLQHALRLAARVKMSPEDMFEQRVSFVYTMLGEKMSKDQVRNALKSIWVPQETKDGEGSDNRE